MAYKTIITNSLNDCIAEQRKIRNKGYRIRKRCHHIDRPHSEKCEFSYYLNKGKK